jgi:hypothetical protein
MTTSRILCIRNHLTAFDCPSLENCLHSTASPENVSGTKRLPLKNVSHTPALFPITSIPAWREAPRDEKNDRYLDFKQFRLCVIIEISQIFVSIICNPDPATWKSIFASSSGLRRALFHSVTGLFYTPPSSFTGIEIYYKPSLSEPLSPSGLLRSHRQPFGCRAA